MFYEIYPTLKNYNNAEKYSLCTEIKNAYLNLLKYMALANKVRSKRKVYLEEADGYLQHCKTLNDLSFQIEEINDGFHKNIDRKLSGIGRMLGGWIKKS